MNLEQLLNEPDIKKFMEKKPGKVVERVKKAAEQLAGKDDDIKALKKILPAIEKNEIAIFFSYKKRDEAAAKEIVEILQLYSAGKFKITYMADYPVELIGKNYRDKIHEDIVSANWFILLFPDRSDDWDWCFFETGIFEGHRTSSDRLICLHTGTNLPDPIGDIQAVSVNVQTVRDFLKGIFTEDDPVPSMDAINPHLKDNKIIEIANTIVDSILQKGCKPLIKEIFEPWVTIKIEYQKDFKSKDDLDKAILMEANESALDLFDYAKKPDTFGDLRKDLPADQKDDLWRDELFHVIDKIIHGRKFNPIQAVFQSKNGKLFRPAVYAVERVNNEKGPIDVFHITFSLEVGAVDDSSMPKNLSTLAIYLRFAFRFRWEILEKFRSGPLSNDDANRLRNILDRIRQDARSRGINDITPLMDIFSPSQAEQINKMYLEWSAVSNAQQTGTLDIAIKNRDFDKIPQILSQFIPASQQFLEMAADKFADMVK